MSGRGDTFASSLTRAVAQRGRLEDAYQELSDHLTRVLQRLYPVWALAGPGLADPGHIDLRSRTIYLDSDALLGSRAQITQGQLERRRVLVCLGVALHETMHAKHSKLWVAEDDAALAAAGERVLAGDRRLLEEPRMEATGCREFGERTRRGRFVHAALAAAVVDVLVPTFAAELAALAMQGRPLSRELCGRGMTYLQARTHYGVIGAAALDPLRPVWEAVLGSVDMRRLDDLYARVIWVADGESEPLSALAREYREIIGERPSEDDEGAGQGEAGEERGSEAPAGPGSPAAGSLSEALEQALGEERTSQLEQLEEDVELSEVVDQATRTNAGAPRMGGRGTGAPGGRLPDRGVDRPPVPEEVAQARRFAQRLRRAQAVGTRTIDKRTPRGRFQPRQHVRAQGQRARGAPVTALPWQIRREIRAPLEQPHVGLVIDSSGSMGPYEYALGPVAWIVQEALRQVDGRCAIALFGGAAALLSDGASPMALVPGITTGGGTAFAGDAIDQVSEHLDMENPRRPRFLYVLSDGGWYDTRAGVERIRALSAAGVPTIHIAIGVAPLAVECDRISVVSDPADALDVVAKDTVEALQAAVRGR